MKKISYIWSLSITLMIVLGLTACAGNKDVVQVDPANISEEEYLALSQEHHNAGDFAKNVRF